MMIFEFTGNQRAGKGIGMTSFALWLALKSYTLRGTFPRIYSNYHFYRYPYFTYFTEWKEIEGVKNAIIVYDELGASQDARLYNSKSQIKFTAIFNQMGKLGNVFIYSCQREFQVEKRVREQTDFEIECIKSYASKILTQTWTDIQRGREPQNRKPIGQHIANMPEKIYQYYNTYEIVESKAQFDLIK